MVFKKFFGVIVTGTMYCLKGNQTSDTGGSGGTWDATWIKLGFGNEVHTFLRNVDYRSGSGV